MSNLNESIPSADGISPSFTGKILLKNTSLNLVGQVAPLLVALFSMPVLIHRLGTERFGVLMLAWMCLGYFNLFDLGLGRALTKNIAERIGTERAREIPKIFWTTMLSMGLLGLIGAGTMALSSDVIATKLLNVPNGLEIETRTALLVISFCLPFVILTSAFKGLLEANQSFATINKIQVPLAVAFYLLPLAFTYYSISLPVIIAALVMSRVVGWVAFFVFALRELPDIRTSRKVELSVLPELLKFGGWVTISNLLIPILAYADRFIIGSVLTLSAVTYYSTPYEIVNKMWIFPGAVMSVVFPALASFLLTNPTQAAKTYFSALKLLVGILTPITLLFILFANEGLSIWVGSEIASKSYEVMKILSLAIFINCLGIVPTAMLDALNKPQISALSHAVQLPVYTAALYFFVPKYGVKGAAIIWVFRNLFDAGSLFLFVHYYFPRSQVRLNGRMFATILVAVFLVMLIGFEIPLRSKLIGTVIIAFCYPYLIWSKFFSAEDRSRVLTVLSAKLASRKMPILQTVERVRIGIALACYKPRMEFFVPQLASLQSQTFEAWECVVSLDSDLDLSQPELAAFVNDPRFTWVRNPGDAGVNRNFEFAAEQLLARPVEMIAFADQDDVWYPHKLQRLAEELRKCPPCSMVHSDMHLFSRSEQLAADSCELAKGWETEMRVVDGYVPLQFLVRNTVTGAACLFDVGLLSIGGRIPSSIKHHDQWFALLASIYGEVRPVHEALHAYRQHGGNVTGVLEYQGLFFKPSEIGWLHGIKKLAGGWLKSRELYQYIESMGFSKSLPGVYAVVLKRPFAGGFLFILMSFLYAQNDPTLARAFLARGIGGLAYFLGLRPSRDFSYET